MKLWIKISLLLCVFGFLKEIRPSEPYIYDYLIGPWRNITKDEVTKEVYPIGTYSNMLLLVVVFLITDICRYKPLIVALGLSGIVIWSLLIWSTSLFALQIVEVFYGGFSAAEVAYYTYIYAKVDKEHYQRVTSYTRAAILAGRAISGITSQALISSDLMDFKQLNYITLTAMIAATCWSIFLPSVKTSIYFHTETAEKLPLMKKVKAAVPLIKDHFTDAFFNGYVLKWSLWWALSTCGYIQVEYYMQPLYEVVENSDEAAYNGAVEAILTLLGFVAALLAGYTTLNWRAKGDLILALTSLVQGGLIVAASQTANIFLCYTLYILFGILYHFMVTIASTQIAQFVDEDSYGLVFGINNFIALIFNTILTSAVAKKGLGFELPIRDQYITYGCFHVGIAVIYIITGLRILSMNNKIEQTTSSMNIIEDNHRF